MTPHAPLKMSSKRHALLHSYSGKFFKKSHKKGQNYPSLRLLLYGIKLLKKKTVSVEFSKEKIRPKNSKCSTIANLV